MESVSNVFRQCSSSVNTVVSIVNSVLPSVQEMTSGAFALEEIKASIRLISLNATIKTTQLGAEGVGMGVIASELQSITRESECDTRIVLDQLDAINETLSNVTREKVNSENSLTVTGGGFVSTELAGLSMSVRAISKEMAVGLNRVRELAEELSTELEHGCSRALNASSITGLFDEQLCDFDEALRQLGYTKEMARTATVGDRTDELSKTLLDGVRTETSLGGFRQRSIHRRKPITGYERSRRRIWGRRRVVLTNRRWRFDHHLLRFTPNIDPVSGQRRNNALRSENSGG